MNHTNTDREQNAFIVVNSYLEIDGGIYRKTATTVLYYRIFVN
jgi:hypothetical protein